MRHIINALNEIIELLDENVWVLYAVSGLATVIVVVGMFKG